MGFHQPAKRLELIRLIIFYVSYMLGIFHRQKPVKNPVKNQVEYSRHFCQDTPGLSVISLWG